jgi:hypothetical protein
MRECILILSFALSASLLFRQLESNSVTVTASQKYEYAAGPGVVR